MLKRKLFTLVTTFIIGTILAAVLMPLNVLIERKEYELSLLDFFIYATYIGPALIIYALPVSFIIDYFTKNSNKSRWLLSLLLYISLGALPYLFVPIFGIFSLSISLIFYTVDELFRMKILRKNINN